MELILILNICYYSCYLMYNNIILMDVLPRINRSDLNNLNFLFNKHVFISYLGQDADRNSRTGFPVLWSHH